MANEANETEMVLVPRIPTKEMTDAAWVEATAEDAAGVWRAMIETWLQTKGGKSGSDKG